MQKKHSLRASLLALVLALAASPFARAQANLATGRAALALQTPAGLETAHQTFKIGLDTFPNNAELNFFYAHTPLACEAHADAFELQFIILKMPPSKNPAASMGLNTQPNHINTLIKALSKT